MPFAEWDPALAGIALPIRGKSYVIPPMGYLDEIRVRASQAAIRVAQADGTEPDPAAVMSNEDFLHAVLGVALDEMRADNVPSITIISAATVAHTFNLSGRTAAEAQWAAGLDPEELAASLKAAQNILTPGTSTTSTSSGSDNGTRSRASTSPTTSRTGTPRKAKAPARRSRGTRSSTAES